MRSLMLINSLTQLFTLIFFSLIFSHQSMALSSDKDKPIELEADSADINDKNGISIYQGNVILTQGSTQLHAETLTLFHNQQHKLTKVVSIGSPAHFKQRPDKQKSDVKAKAGKIIYYVKKEIVHLYDNASFWQEKNSFSGDKIIYDTKNDIVKASSKKTTDEKSQSGGRVKVTIQSEKSLSQK